MSDEEADAERLKQWKRRGLLLSDEQVLEALESEDNMARLCCSRTKDGSLAGDLASREEFKLLRKYVFAWLSDMVDDIAQGNVTPNPYTRGSTHNACAYCPYGAVCHESTVEGRRNYKTVEAKDFWEEVKKEVDRRG